MADKRNTKNTGKRRRGMPWRNPTDWWQVVQMFLSVAGAVALGTVARIIDQVQAGHRDSFWTKRLFIDGIGLIAMVFIAVGVGEYFDLGRWATTATAVTLGRIGPPAIDNTVEALTHRLRGK